MGMVAFEQDFVGQDSMGFGWPRRLGAGAEWLRGMGAAAAKVGAHQTACHTSSHAPPDGHPDPVQPTSRHTTPQTGTPIQYSLPVASDLLESLSIPWVTTARASAAGSRVRCVR